VPSLESAHAVVWDRQAKSRWGPGDVVVFILSGRGDKDVSLVAETGAVHP